MDHIDAVQMNMLFTTYAMYSNLKMRFGLDWIDGYEQEDINAIISVIKYHKIDEWMPTDISRRRQFLSTLLDSSFSAKAALQLFNSSTISLQLEN